MPHDSLTSASGTSIDASVIDGETQSYQSAIETEMSGVRFGLPVPDGWSADVMDGLILAEHLGRMDEAGASAMPGILVYLFVPRLDQFDVPAAQTDNVAYHVLNQVVRMPTEIGSDVLASSPEPFQWGSFDAAYYLLSSSDGTRTLVLALELADSERLVVANISAPEDQAPRIRSLLPLLMDGLWIDSIRLDGRELDRLPFPLNFPSRSETAGSGRPMIVELPSPAVQPLTPSFFFTLPPSTDDVTDVPDGTTRP